MGMDIRERPKAMIHFCDRHGEFFDICECCVPPWGHNVELIQDLNDRFWRHLASGRWAHTPFCEIPRRVIIRVALIVAGELSLKIDGGAPLCPRCREECGAD